MALWILDAGHGGVDSGVVGKFKRKESDVTLSAVLEAKKHLERNGEKVLLTRNSDDTLRIEERIKSANENKGCFFVSFHMNSNIDNKLKGVEVHYLKNN